MRVGYVSLAASLDVVLDFTCALLDQTSQKDTRQRRNSNIDFEYCTMAFETDNSCTVLCEMCSSSDCH